MLRIIQACVFSTLPFCVSFVEQSLVLTVTLSLELLTNPCDKVTDDEPDELSGGAK